MNYLTFLLKDPVTSKIHYVGVKYKKTIFSEKDIERIRKTGSTNTEIKQWIKLLKSEGRSPVLEIVYQGDDSCEACFQKQQYIINHENPNIELIGVRISTKKYTKRLRLNEKMRRPIIDQKGNYYPGVLDAAEALFLAPSNISKVLHGKLDHIGGYRFKFAEED